MWHKMLKHQQIRRLTNANSNFPIKPRFHPLMVYSILVPNWCLGYATMAPDVFQIVPKVCQNSAQITQNMQHICSQMANIMPQKYLICGGRLFVFRKAYFSVRNSGGPFGVPPLCLTVFNHYSHEKCLWGYHGGGDSRLENDVRGVPKKMAAGRPRHSWTPSVLRKWRRQWPHTPDVHSPESAP